MTQIPVFVISMKGSEKRFAAVEAGLARFGLEPTRIGAINGRRKAGLIKRKLGRQFHCERHGRPMTDGEIGCLASHIKVLRRIVREKLPAAIVLEDDVEFRSGFGQFVHEDAARVLQVADIVKIEGGLFPHVSIDGITLLRTKSCRAVVPLKPSLCSAAYAVTLRGAQTLVELAERIDEPFDFILNGYHRYRARYCELRPLLSRQAIGTSVIGGDGRDKAPLSDLAESSPVSKARKVIFRLVNAGSGLAFALRLALRERGRPSVRFNPRSTVQRPAER